MLKQFILSIVFAVLAIQAFGEAELQAPDVILVDVPFEVSVSGLEQGQSVNLQLGMDGTSVLDKHAVADEEGKATFKDLTVEELGRMSVLVQSGTTRLQKDTRSILGLLSLLPPLVAVLLAIVFRQVILALLTGIWLGAVVIYDWNPFVAFLRLLDKYIISAYTDTSHMIIICFTMLLGGMVGIISRAAGTRGLVDLLSGLAKSSTSTQLATWLMGIAIFFDDYANSLFVGTAMRPLCDRYRVSREKLSYLIDTTAAPVANIALISTWIGFEVSLIGDAFQQIGVDKDPYLTFLYSIPYRFYPILAILFPFLLIVMRRDFGPMLPAEVRSRTTGKVLSEKAIPLADYESSELLPHPEARGYWQIAVVPILVAVISILVSMWVTGYQAIASGGKPIPGGTALLRDVLANADSYRSLLWGAALGCVAAMILAMSLRVLNLRQTLDSWIAGMRSMFLAAIILGLAWSIGSVCADIKTANYLVHFLGPKLSPYWIPALTTVVAALISFAVGSSWATMSIVMPLVIPLIWFRTSGMGPEAQGFFLIATVSSVLAGATFGDHASPISDTTILSSIFSGSDHIDHVRTQAPYAVVVAIVAILVGDLATAYGLPVWIALVVSTLILGAVIRFFGKPVSEYKGE